MTTSFKKLYKLAEPKICACPDHEEFTTKYKAKYITGHNRKKYPLMNKVCKCPDQEVFTTRNPKQEFIYGHNQKGVVYTEEQNKKNSESKIGIPRTPEWIENMSKARQLVIAKEGYRDRMRQETILRWAKNPNMKLPPSNGRGVPTKYRGVQMRSKLEARVAKVLDTYCILWEYEPKRFDLKSCTYMPDFYLPEFNIYLEVKPSNSYEKHPELYKVDLFRQSGKSITIVAEKDLKGL